MEIRMERPRHGRLQIIDFLSKLRKDLQGTLVFLHTQHVDEFAKGSLFIELKGRNLKVIASSSMTGSVLRATKEYVTWEGTRKDFIELVKARKELAGHLAIIHVVVEAQRDFRKKIGFETLEEALDFMDFELKDQILISGRPDLCTIPRTRYNPWDDQNQVKMFD